MIQIGLLGLISLIFSSLHISSLQAKHVALTSYIREGGPPTAILPGDREVEVGMVVTISGSGSSDPEEDELMFRWNLEIVPQNSNSKIDDPAAEEISFTADVAGLYIVRLIVSDDISNSHPAYMAIRVLNANMPPEIPDFHSYREGNDQGVPYELFFVIGEGRRDPDGEIVSYELDFGDGKTTYATARELESGEIGLHPQISHFYESPGSYTARLAAIDDRGARTTVTTDVSIVNNKLPKPIFSATVTPNAQDSTSYDIQLDGSSSSDPDGTITSYDWEITAPDGTEYNPGTGPSQTYTVSANNLGEYSIRLWVGDNGGKARRARASVYVGTDNPNFNSAPSLIYAIGPRLGTAPLTVNFDATGSFDIDGDTIEYFWWFDSRHFDISDGARTPTASYTYDLPGTYHAILALRDSHGNMVEHGFNIYVKAPVDVDIIPKFFPTEGDDGPLSVNFSYDGRHYGMVDNIPSYQTYWDFGDGARTIRRYAHHTYEREGTYLVKLTTIDVTGVRRSVVRPLTVRNDGAFPELNVEVEEGTRRPVNTPVIFNHANSQSGSGAPLSFSYFFNEKDPLISNVIGGSIPHTFTETGRYSILTWTEEEGRSALNYLHLFIFDGEFPQANFSMNKRVGIAPLTINFNAGTSSDDGTISSYDWHFGDYDAHLMDMVASGANTNHTYNNPEERWPQLFVTDELGNIAPMGAKVIILESVNSSNQSPTASFTYTVDELTVHLDASGSTDADGEIWFYDWTLGTEHVINDNNGNPHRSYTFSQASSHQVTLKITDSDGGTHTSTQTIVVTAPPSNGDDPPDEDKNNIRISPTPHYSLNRDKQIVVTPSRYNYREEIKRRRAWNLRQRKSGCERVNGKQYCYGNLHRQRHNIKKKSK